MVTAWVYIMASASRTIYVSYTKDLHRRVWAHKTHFREGFTKQHNVTKLVYVAYDDAIAWEKSLKGKSRAKKVALIEDRNPRWNDLAWNWYEGDEQLGHEAGDESASHGDPSLVC